jgi:hypothetical protein
MRGFIYGWGNDYAGATVSNLDVTLRTLQAVAPQPKIIVVMQPGEEAHIGTLLTLFSIHAMFTLPVAQEKTRVTLQSFA